MKLAPGRYERQIELAKKVILLLVVGAPASFEVID